ncbi:60Kd inner membrane protein-domain-containing protein [Dunaliella salina]|uniref:60Kd inner membrane protein-domain-containing protein n=1 Tax=Dunaliella salina TaxID=3046 RepID=A0ABQ7G7S5_DUNSA|nr:60Kd inner membrane protein-domain-containing protein [Dunaliella salina]|eukprot:KAF5830652.1 60Kd inner membrane protein-domain-containing protein [Dunaliella salina]
MLSSRALSSRCPAGQQTRTQLRGGAAASRGLGRLPSRKPVAVRALLEIDQSSAAANSAVDVFTHHFNQLASVAEDAAIQTAAAASSSGAAPAAEAAKDNGAGPFDGLALVFESLLEALDSVLEKVHVPYSYGFAIILLTVIVKVAAFPLTQKQVQSTVALQALQPRVKELQAKYANDQQALQLETARLYKEAGVNPLAGCLPTLATIPVFIGLYRALTLAAQDNLLNDAFFWIPSLAGPASLADQRAGAGLQWLFPFVDGHPPIGWGTAGAYLVMPVLLVLSQYVSQRIISPPSDDPAQQQSQNILKFLPLMIGWFSLNVPAGLTLYWFVNNILSTAQQVYLKSTTKVNIPEPATMGPAAGQPYIAPKEEKVKRVAGKEVNARKKRREDGEVGSEVASTNGRSSASPEPSNASSPRKGSKFRARQAREAAAKAAQAAAAQSTSPAPAPPASTNGSSTNGSSSPSPPPAEAARKESETTASGSQ